MSCPELKNSSTYLNECTNFRTRNNNKASNHPEAGRHRAKKPALPHLRWNRSGTRQFVKSVGAFYTPVLRINFGVIYVFYRISNKMVPILKWSKPFQPPGVTRS